MARKILLYRFGSIMMVTLLQSCTPATIPETSTDTKSSATRQLEFLYFDGCPNSPVLAHRLEIALDQSGWFTDYHRIDLTELASDDPRLRFGSPTILFNGADLFGTIPTHSPALNCRHYPDGLPDVDTIVTQLGEDDANL